MRKVVLFLFIILIIFSAVLLIFYYAGTSKTILGDNSEKKPWNVHIDTALNTTLDAALVKNPSFQRLRCYGDDTDKTKKPFGNIQAICLQGNGAKMVVPLFGGKMFVFDSPLQGGLFEQEHETAEMPLGFFDKNSKSQTKYFLIPFEGYEVPTYYPVESQKYLPVWKKLFQNENGISDDYFGKHIFVVGTSLSGGRFSVVYYYSVDWAYLKLTDNLVVDKINTGEVNLNKFKPLERLAKKSQIETVLRDFSLPQDFDLNENIYLDNNGELFIRVQGVEDEEANKCFSAKVFLKNAEASEIQDTACSVY